MINLKEVQFLCIVSLRECVPRAILFMFSYAIRTKIRNSFDEFEHKYLRVYLTKWKQFFDTYQ